MGILITIVVALLLAVAVFMANTRTAAPPVADPPVVETRVLSPSHAEYQQRLAELANSEPPKELSPGASCYGVAAPPARFDYVCPTCQTKTVHARVKILPLPAQWELDACRRQIKQIKGLNVELIETGFCATCFPKAHERSLDLVVHNADGTSHRVDNIRSEDLTLIAEFLAGATKHQGSREQETPLRDHLPRLRQLLGLPEKTK